MNGTAFRPIGLIFIFLLAIVFWYFSGYLTAVQSRKVPDVEHEIARMVGRIHKISDITPEYHQNNEDSIDAALENNLPQALEGRTFRGSVVGCYKKLHTRQLISLLKTDMKTNRREFTSYAFLQFLVKKGKCVDTGWEAYSYEVLKIVGDGQRMPYGESADYKHTTRGIIKIRVISERKEFRRPLYGTVILPGVDT